MDELAVGGIVNQEGEGHKPAAMTVGEFLDLPRELGWKYELLGGRLHRIPSPYAVATLRLALTRKIEDERWTVRPLVADDRDGLVRLFYLAFADSVEYHDCSRGYVRQRAEQSLSSFYDRAGQPWHSAARLIEDGTRILAAALVRTSKHGPILEPLMVRPGHQRQGLATALMGRVVNHVLGLGAGELFSQCHLANAASLAWHQRFGFEEMPDEWVASHRARHYRHELERCTRLGGMKNEELSTLTALTTQWEAEAERMRELSERHFEAAHPQLM